MKMASKTQYQATPVICHYQSFPVSLEGEVTVLFLLPYGE